MAEYKLLEPNLTRGLTDKGIGFNTSATPSFFASTSFIYTLAFVVIIAAASFRYAYAGTLRINPSEANIKKSKEEFTRVTYGLLGVLGLWLVLFTVNKDMLTGDVTLANLRAEVGGGGVSINTGAITGIPSGTSASCSNIESIKASVQAGGAGICANTSCSLTACTTNSQYKTMIQNIAGSNWKMALVLMCKESGGNKDAQNKNPNGTYDCGLMQVNQAAPCDATVLDPQRNIEAGVAKLQEKINSSVNAAQYPNIQVRPETAIFTAYNCCANGTIPNSPSVSCAQSDGWPSMPKWACPIDPGEGKYNMCGVKAYACDLTACLTQLN